MILGSNEVEGKSSLGVNSDGLGTISLNRIPPTHKLLEFASSSRLAVSNVGDWNLPSASTTSSVSVWQTPRWHPSKANKSGTDRKPKSKFCLQNRFAEQWKFEETTSNILGNSGDVQINKERLIAFREKADFESFALHCFDDCNSIEPLRKSISIECLTREDGFASLMIPGRTTSVELRRTARVNKTFRHAGKNSIWN